MINLIFMTIPVIWMYLLGNILTQYVCISSVFVLTTECSSLTVTLVLTLRKFTSLIISIIYFNNPFTAWHWLGTTFVFVGTLMFTNIIKIFKDNYYNKKKSHEWLLAWINSYFFFFFFVYYFLLHTGKV